MIRKPSRHFFAPVVDQLEARRLLASSASYIKLENLDVAGPTAGAGPGGYKNLHLQLTVPRNGSTDPIITYLNVAGPPGFEWTYGTTGSGVANTKANPVIAIQAKSVASGATSQMFDPYFSPVVTSVDASTGATSTNTLTSGKGLSITLGYKYAQNGSVTTESAASNSALIVTPQDLDGSVNYAMSSLPDVTVGAYSGSFLGQTADGNALIRISGLPAGTEITRSTAQLSDIAGRYWTVDTTYGRPGLGMTITQAPNATTADIAFPPRRDEAGSTLTFRYRLGGPKWYVTEVALGAAQHTDPNLRDNGPVDLNTPAVVDSPTATTNVVTYTDDAGRQQTIDFQQLLNSTNRQVISLNEGTYNLSKPLGSV